MGLKKLLMLTCSKYLFLRVTFLICLVPFNFLKAEIRNLPNEEIQKRAYNLQDRPSFYSGNPLKGFSKFNFFSRFYAPTPKYAEKIQIIIENELKKFGKINKIEMSVKTEKGEAIDLSGFDDGISLAYEIKNVLSIDRKELGIVRASLNLSTSVDVQKTKEECMTYIWSDNCFLKGNVEKDLEKLVSQSLKYLLHKFEINYSAVNSDQPIFNLYAP
ncbi:MAG: hypothetical protein ACM3JI_00910 [Anaerolineae bacterium]